MGEGKLNRQGGKPGGGPTACQQRDQNIALWIWAIPYLTFVGKDMCEMQFFFWFHETLIFQAVFTVAWINCEEDYWKPSPQITPRITLATHMKVTKSFVSLWRTGGGRGRGPNKCPRCCRCGPSEPRLFPPIALAVDKYHTTEPSELLQRTISHFGCMPTWFGGEFTQPMRSPLVDSVHKSKWPPVPSLREVDTK